MGDGAPFVHARCRGMLGGCLGGPARACGASARRHSQLHRWGMQRLHTRRGAAILQPFSAACSMDHAVVLHTRARRSRIARRGVARRDFSLSDKLGRTHSHFDLPRPRTRYGDGIDQCESSQGYLRQTSAPAEHALVTAHRQSTLQRNRAATHGNARSVFGPRLLRTTNEAVAAPVAPS